MPTGNHSESLHPGESKVAQEPMPTGNHSESLHPGESKVAQAPMPTGNHSESLHPGESRLHRHLCLLGTTLNPFTLERADTPVDFIAYKFCCHHHDLE